MSDRTLSGTSLSENDPAPDEGFIDRDGHFRNKWGAIPGYCPCGSALTLEEMDWNDGICDECDADDEADDRDDDDLEYDDD